MPERWCTIDHFRNIVSVHLFCSSSVYKVLYCEIICAVPEWRNYSGINYTFWNRASTCHSKIAIADYLTLKQLSRHFYHIDKFIGFRDL